jgi:hypothetical protein
MTKRRITAREILADVKRGLSDPTLMEKYKLSAQGLQSVFQKLLKAGVITQTELDSRIPLGERTVDIGLYICTACGNIQGTEFTKCPRCGFEPPRGSNPPEAETQELVTPRKPGVKRATKRLDAGKSRGDPAAELGGSAEAEPLSSYQQVVRYSRVLRSVAAVSYVVLVIALLLVAGLAARQPSAYSTQVLIGLLAIGLLGTVLFFLSQVVIGMFRHVSRMISPSDDSP